MEVIDSRSFEEGFQPLIAALQVLGKENFPQTRRSLRRAAYHIRDYWIQSASGYPIKGTNEVVRNVEYAKSIQTFQIDDFHMVVGTTDPGLHNAVVDGTEDRDLKTEVAEGKFKNTRYSKDGSAYAVIPFRHKMKSLKRAKRRKMLDKDRVSQKYQSVWSLINTKNKSRIHMDPKTKMRRYQMGSKISEFKEEIQQEWHKRDIFAGMVRFDTSTGEAGSSTYMTFRTVSVKSDPRSWIIPGKKGVPITRLVLDAKRDEAVMIIKEGIVADFAMLGTVRF